MKWRHRDIKATGATCLLRTSTRVVCSEHDPNGCGSCCNPYRSERVFKASTPLHPIQRRDGAVAVMSQSEARMMNMMQGCSGWLMAAGGIVTYASLILVGAACIKYLFFGKPSSP
jgi:hypothetical protein